MAAQCALIIAGGQSRRFGSDKTALELDGQLILVHLVNVLRATNHEVSILGPQNAHLSSLGCQVFPDQSPFDGGMRAVADAMEYLSCRDALVIAADMPFASPRVISAMWSALGDNLSVSLQGAVLPVIYTEAVVPVMRSLLAQGEKRFKQLHARLLPKTYSIPKSVWTDLDPRKWTTQNINFPEDWNRCQKNCFT